MNFRSVIDKLLVWRQDRHIRRRFVKKRTETELAALLLFAIESSRPLPLSDKHVRQAIFSMDSWNLGKELNHKKELEDHLFLSIEGLLIRDAQNSLGSEWQKWLQGSRVAGRCIDTMNPAICRALLCAVKTHKLTLNTIAKEDRDYLLECFRQHYEEALQRLGPKQSADAIPLLLQFAALENLRDATSSHSKMFLRWAQNRPIRPRALAAMDDDQALRAPLRGVGSPHGISVTFYSTASSPMPLRIACAGITGDPVINAKVFTSMFALALASTREPTFVMSNGAIISLDSDLLGSADEEEKSILAAVLGPAGPVQPSSGTVSLGMSQRDAIMLVTEQLQTLQEETGLVQVTRWRVEDRQSLESRIVDAVQAAPNGPRVINTDHDLTANGGVVDVLPLFRKDIDGKAVPIELEISSKSLGPRRVSDLMRQARNSYMQDLIAAGRRREAMAAVTFAEQDRLVKLWNSQSEVAKEELCRQNPNVTITRSVDFELGIVIRLTVPQTVSHREFEEGTRPSLRDSALHYQKKFGKLCEELKLINSDGGKADSLTLKLLVDSLIRHAPLYVEDSTIQLEYVKWVEHYSPVVWEEIIAQAKEIGIPVEVLAGDNVVFNVRSSANQDFVLIQPMMLVDLHDFVAFIRSDGFTDITPAGKAASLQDVLIADKATSVQTIGDIRERYYSWLRKKMEGVNPTQFQVATATPRFITSERIEALVGLRRAKQLLYRGNATAAAAIIKRIRNVDFAPIYFWGAVTHQFRFILHMKYAIHEYKPSYGDLAQQVLNLAVSDVINCLKGKRAHLDKQTEEFIGQLQAADPLFVNGLQNKDLSGELLQQLEQESIAISPEEDEQVRSASNALASLEMLDLAESMKRTGQALPFRGAKQSDVEKELNQIVAASDALSFHWPESAAQIAELPNLIGQSKTQH